jgi:hypothetical protein
MTDYVSNEPLRARFEQLNRHYGVTMSDVALDLGWGTQARPHTNLVAWSLGLKARSRKGRAKLQERVTYNQAVRLCRALDMDPHEAGV